MEDHFAQLIRRTAPATERVKKSLLRGLGLITRLVVYAALFGVLYLFAPENIFDRPIGSLTLSEIFKSIIWFAVGAVLIHWLFNPDDDDSVREAWGGLGILLIVGSVLLTGYLGW